MKHNFSRGAVSRVLLILGAVILVIIVIIFVVIKINGNKNIKKADLALNSESEKKEIPKPVYETTMQNIKFTFKEAENLGSTLKAKSQYDTNLVTTEKFIKIIVGAQNKGKVNTGQYAWELGNIVDSEGRIFIPNNQAYFFLPKPDLCGVILKPEFQATPCARIYEVSKVSKNLKIEVRVNEPKRQVEFLDITFN